uniref:Uncharacterized protein LOC114338198 n=1 Tax=Diabrotica virgifera virgifera TaxID=50390 RepID=A0A6P7GLD5_DIAVI
EDETDTKIEVESLMSQLDSESSKENGNSYSYLDLLSSNNDKHKTVSKQLHTKLVVNDRNKKINMTETFGDVVSILEVLEEADKKSKHNIFDVKRVVDVSLEKSVMYDEEGKPLPKQQLYSFPCSVENTSLFHNRCTTNLKEQPEMGTDTGEKNDATRSSLCHKNSSNYK